MRNYVIINEINSNTIQGLAINILPPITKPMMRSQIEEIDGRDGDLVTELGYSAYDKTMEIGLWGTYDIDAIIKYFTGEGTIVFSTEPDKYYYFKILNQIDYEKLLKFKKATVTFHCQPYKYPTSETPLEEAYEYVEDTGTDLTLNNTGETIFNKFDLIGNTYQDSTTGKNVFYLDSLSDTTQAGVTIRQDIDGGFVLNGTSTGSAYFRVQLATNINEAITLYLKTQDSNGNIMISLRDSNLTQLANVRNNNNTLKVANYTPTNPIQYIELAQITNGVTYNNYKIYPMVVKGTYTSSTIEPYEPYTGGIPAPNPSYPEQVHVVSGDNTINICGKNLFDYNKITTSANYTNNYDGTFTRTSNGSNILINVDNASVPYDSFSLLAGTYSVSFDIKTTVDVTLNNLFLCTRQNGTASNLAKSIGVQIPANTTTHIKAENYVVVNNAEKVGFAGYLSASTGVVISNIQVEKNNQATTYEEYKDDTYPISLGAENLIAYGTNLNGFVDQQSKLFVVSGASVGYYFRTAKLPSVISFTSPNGNRNNVSYFNSIPEGGVQATLLNNGNNTNSRTIDVNKNYTYVFIQFSFNYLSVGDIEITKGNTIQRITDNPIEMCSIPNTDYKDTFVHEDNKWYKYAMVKKLVLDGSETGWNSSVVGTDIRRFYKGFTDDGIYRYTDTNRHIDKIKSNYFYGTTNNAVGGMYQYQNQVFFQMDNSIYTTTESCLTWLNSHNLILYFALANSTQTEITDETLIGQLDDLWENATSYKGQTNITQTNNELPFILDVSALKDGSDHLIIDNIGTAYSKPTIDIEGTGIVDIYLNDEQIFEIDMTTQNEIIIDTEKMEAYTPDNLLANRLVTGDYSNFKLAPGENDLRFSGDLTKATVTRYIRWI